ncbi:MULTISPECIES: zinc ribbon domain-containing protein [unclassified Mesorhizobium]|uniref:zinc ribbon domain-containing protein n=1 Tax=unclassified Mesorhizobium TaxID=325217 RepID=UPI001AEE2552|nr:MULTISPECIES: zinc ribbon domain-containing protein [unclassified Mesorhizobium]
MTNQRRLADNTNRYEAGHRGSPRKGIALLQGLAVCGQCGRRMTVRYSGPDSACPVYCCLADRNQTGSSLCQEVRAPAVDELVAQTLLKALEPDQIAIAIAALDEIAEETRSLEKQWTLRRECARYDAERARRQYDTVEPENRLVARTLEKAWEDKLRWVDEIEQEYRRWRDREPLVVQTQDHAGASATRREFAGYLALRNHPTRRPQTYLALYRAGGRSRPEEDTRPGRHQDSLADRRNQPTSNPTPSSILRSRLWRTRACA